MSASAGKPRTPKVTLDAVMQAADVLRAHITNTIPVLNKAVKEGKTVLFEGAQGAMLDIDFGTYPFVTSSNTSAGGCCTGSGVAPTRINKIIGVCKAYTTRVGAGPFVTEDAEIADYLHGLGREFGATTGRPRRCGWTDGVVLRFSAMFNGFDEMAMTNLDGLDERDTIKICTGYRMGDQVLEYPLPSWRTGSAANPSTKPSPAGSRTSPSAPSGKNFPPTARPMSSASEKSSAAPSAPSASARTASKPSPCPINMR